MTTYGFWYGLVTGIFAGFSLCVVSIMAVMCWYDVRSTFGIESEDD